MIGWFKPDPRDLCNVGVLKSEEREKMSYVQIVQRLPEEWRPVMLELVEVMEKDMREQLAVRRQDFDALTAVVQELAEAQKRTEQRLDRLEAVVQELAQAQKRTEQRVEELAQAQKRTEQRVEELAQAQIQTRKDLHAHLSAIGARWGMQTEESFRTAIQAILGEFAGLRVERFTAYDAEGEVFGRPDQVEIDVLVRNGQTILGEIKASMSRGDVYLLARKVAFYERRQGVKVDRTIIITPMLDPRAQPVANALGIQVYTSAYDFGET
jgi:hypothetical protein